ncbi:major facilitator superfamily domain-containing protein [Boeremia exigua]|uniref:major facilitator superfamily domain-containing protein n=1 Tax=Boeremia exigua TaxID=749465 RepID=UPI001E8DB8EC|nr:major facilitator superfamily domain-containing protein [Boeremia exigua]KAH6616845.1 major facilitator superfamily domain-containing protein [Boeremia exigua]
MLLPSSSASSIAWIGSTQAFLLLSAGALTGPLYDAGYFRALLFTGTLLLVAGQTLLSLCTSYTQIFLAQALCIGFGTAALFVPSVAILTTYFSTRIGAAIGLAAAGSSAGGVLYPIAFHALLPRIGFPWTTRALALLVGATMAIPCAVMRPRTRPPHTRALLDLAAFRIPAYTLQVAGFATGFMGLYMPFFFAQTYALDRRLTSPDLAFYLLAIMNGASVFGRIVPNVAADRVGALNVVVPCCAVAGALCVCYVPVTGTPGLCVLMAVYGFFSGAFVSLPPTVVVALSQDARDKIGTRMGQSFFVVGVGVLVGTPVGGAVLDRWGWGALWGYGGGMLFLGAGFLGAARMVAGGWRWRVKV